MVPLISSDCKAAVARVITFITCFMWAVYSSMAVRDLKVVVWFVLKLGMTVMSSLCCGLWVRIKVCVAPWGYK